MDGLDPERIPTNLRAMMILETIGHQTEPITAAEIGRQVGLPKQTIHRLCNTLVDQGFLAREAGGLKPGRRSRAMATGILHASTSHIARHQILKRLANDTRETVNFAVPEENGMSYKDRVETDWPFRVQLPVGSHVPFHCTASGKTYLACLPKRDRERVVRSLTLARQTENTFSDPDDLLDGLKSIARQGYALDNEEFIVGMIAVAVPIRDQSGRFVASLGVHGPVQRYSLERAAEIAPRLEFAAQELSNLLSLH